MVIWTILDHFGPAHFPTVLRPFPKRGFVSSFDLVVLVVSVILVVWSVKTHNLERKKPIKKNHIKEFGGRMPRRRPRDKLGTSQGHLGHLGLIYV